MLRVRVSAPIRASEDPKKVERAVQTLLPDGRLTTDEGRVVAEGDNLDAFRKLVWKQRILDAARRRLLASLDETGERASFILNKQAAYAGLVSFAVAEAPLGDVRVEVEGESLESVFKEIAPPTLKGRPVSEEQYELHLERQRKRKGQGKYQSREEEPLAAVRARDEEE